MAAGATHVDEWTGEDVTIAEIEEQLARLRTASDDHSSDLRTSVMTHLAWVPLDWLKAATETLGGLAERHPSRTILLVPDPDAGDALNAEVSLRCFAIEGASRNVCSEVIELHLGGDRAAHPASVVEPLLISDLPVFLRWRGQPPFGAGEFEQLVDVTDRLVVDSVEWPDLPEAYGRLAEAFERAAVSDIAWTRTLGWRRSLAALWPEIGSLERLEVEGPQADALLLAAWLRARLEREIELDHTLAKVLESVRADGEDVAPPRGDRASASELLSAELDLFGRDPAYEEAAIAAAAA